MAAIRLAPNGSGTQVGWATGYQGYCFNCRYGPHVLSMGYPYDTHPPRSGICGQDLYYSELRSQIRGFVGDSMLLDAVDQGIARLLLGT